MSLFAAVSVVLFDDQGQVLMIKENYGRHRYGLPGGAIEPNEAPHEAAIRETQEETGLHVTLDHLIGIYRFTGASNFISYVFKAQNTSSQPSLPATGEIAELIWVDPSNIAQHSTFVAPHAIKDALAKARGVIRDIKLEE